MVGGAIHRVVMQRESTGVSWSSTSLAIHPVPPHRTAELCLDKAFLLIEGHPAT